MVVIEGRENVKRQFACTFEDYRFLIRLLTSTIQLMTGGDSLKHKVDTRPW